MSAASSDTRLDTRVPTPGCTWLSSYLIEQEMSRQGDEKLWIGTHVQSMLTALIFEAQSPDLHHEAAWERLRSCKSDRLLMPLEGRLVDDRRYSIFPKPNAVGLDEWMKHHPPPGPEQLIAWINDLYQALTALHVNGLAHAHMDPETIWVEESAEAAPRLLLGGLEHVVLTERKEPVTIVADPFYAPPESLDGENYAPGDGLRGWDWWSLGRIVQELILGRHILEHLVDHTLYRLHPEDRDFAVSLLRETAHGNTRAGGVEAMPAMDKRLDKLLYGLLTTARDGRWGREDVRLWLDGAEPRDLYRMARHERLFRFKERAYTVQEAAELLRSAEYWGEARKHLTDAEDPSTLLSFLRSDSSLSKYLVHLDDVRQTMRSPELKTTPVAIVTEATLILMLQRLAGGVLVWKGKRLDEAGAREVLAVDDPKNEHVAVFGVLTLPVTLKAYDALVPTSARILSEGAQAAAKALEILVKEKWIQRGATKEVLRMWRLAFEAGATQQALLGDLRRLYARSNNETVQALFAKNPPTKEEALVLAWMLPQASARFGFVSHEAWGQEQKSALMEEGRRVSEQLFWIRLERLLKFGPAWFGGMIALLLFGGLAGVAISFGWPGGQYAPGALLPLLIALVMRTLLFQYLQPYLPERIRASGGWSWIDGPRRCRRELADLQGEAVSPGALRRRLREINEKLEGMKGESGEVSIISQPARMGILLLAALASWAMSLGPTVAGLYVGLSRPDPWLSFVETWNPKEPDIEWYPPPQLYKVPFPFEVPRRAPSARIVEMGVATPEEIKLANRRGGFYVQDYDVKEIAVPVLVRIPSGDLYAFMLFDAKRGQTMGNKVYYLRSVPRQKSFVNIEGQITFVPDW